MRYAAFLIFLLWTCSVQAEGFQDWLAHYKIRAVQAGASQNAVENALRNIEYDPRVIELDQKQPETQQTLQEYIDKAVTAKRIEKGRDMLESYPSILNAVQNRTGVPKEILIALWGRETEYGGYTGDFETVDALATLAYEGRRRAFFEQELLEAIVLLNRLGWAPDQMRGSWAGAVGQCQFMPTSYVKYGVDGNGDGKVNLWDSMSDVFYSMASKLSADGWKPGAGWGQKIQIPPGFDKSLLGRDKTPYDIHFWEQRGVRFTKPVPAQAATAIRLYQPDGPDTTAYALYPNFDVLIAWNKSGYFATAVGLLADRISSD